MELNVILTEINKILKGIISRTELIERESRLNGMSRIEIDIIMSEIKNLYELYFQLTRFVDSDAKTISEVTGIKGEMVKVKSEELKEPKVKSQKIKAGITRNEEVKEVKVNPEKQEQKVSEVQEETTTQQSIDVQTTPIDLHDDSSFIKVATEDIKANRTLKSDLFSDGIPETIADKFKDNKTSINDRIGQNKTDLSIAEKLKHSQSTDIKTLIGINEKFLFINELFEGNMGEYNEFINKLNLAGSKSEANSILNDEKALKTWKDNLNSLNKLQELIEARF